MDTRTLEYQEPTRNPVLTRRYLDLLHGHRHRIPSLAGAAGERIRALSGQIRAGE